MAISRTCDICGKGVRADIATQFIVGDGRLKVRIIRAVDGTWNGGDCCVDCIRALVADAPFVAHLGIHVPTQGSES